MDGHVLEVGTRAQPKISHFRIKMHFLTIAACRAAKTGCRSSFAPGSVMQLVHVCAQAKHRRDRLENEFLVNFYTFKCRQEFSRKSLERFLLSFQQTYLASGSTKQLSTISGVEMDGHVLEVGTRAQPKISHFQTKMYFFENVACRTAQTEDTRC